MLAAGHDSPADIAVAWGSTEEGAVPGDVTAPAAAVVEGACCSGAPGMVGNAFIWDEGACGEIKEWLEYTHAELEKAPSGQLFPRLSRETTVRVFLLA